MLTSGFTNAPVSKFLLFGLVTSSLVVSISDVKYLFYIYISPHIWQYRQLWRISIWQLCYTNSTELFFAAMTLYHLRIIERLWGSRKFASFLCIVYASTAVITPSILGLILRPLSFNKLNYLPAGLTPVLFALLAQYHAAIPYVYKYRVTTSANSNHEGIILSDKSTTYLIAGQLALSQFPGSALAAVVGWVVGYAWRREVLPGTGWRIPGWFIGEGKRGLEDAGYEGLRRRLEGESAATASASGVEGRQGQPGRRRTLGGQILDRFRGAF